MKLPAREWAEGAALRSAPGSRHGDERTAALRVLPIGLDEDDLAARPFARHALPHARGRRRGEREYVGAVGVDREQGGSCLPARFRPARVDEAAVAQQERVARSERVEGDLPGPRPVLADREQAGGGWPEPLRSSADFAVKTISGDGSPASRR